MFNVSVLRQDEMVGILCTARKHQEICPWFSLYYQTINLRKQIPCSKLHFFLCMILDEFNTKLVQIIIIEILFSVSFLIFFTKQLEIEMIVYKG